MARRTKSDAEPAVKTSNADKARALRIGGIGFACAMGLMIPGWFLADACDHRQAAHFVRNAVWVATSAGERIAIHEQLNRSSENGDWVVDRVILLDPQDGTLGEPWILDDDGSEYGAALRGGRGGFLWFHVGGDAQGTWASVGTEGGALRGLDAMVADYPAVASPWFSSTVGEDGLLYVEADDKAKWQIDIGMRAATVTEASMPTWSGGPYVGCTVNRWPAGASERAFLEVPTERHSDPAKWALVEGSAQQISMTISGFGATKAFETPVPTVLAPGFTSPAFLCNDSIGMVLLDGDALVREVGPAQVSRVTKEGTRVWTWVVPEQPATESSGTATGVEVWEAWPFGDGVIVRTDRRFTALTASGAERWSVVR